MFSGLKNRIVKAFALDWLKGKAKALRGKDKETLMGKVLKFLDGWKLMLGVLVYFAAKIYDAHNNGHTGDIVGSVLSVFGWIPGPQSGFTLDGIALSAGSAAMVIGFFAKLYKAQRQYAAGSGLTGMLTTDGYLAKATAESFLSDKAEAHYAAVVNKADVIAADKYDAAQKP